jgi:SAM-dependent methyltransferase
VPKNQIPTRGEASTTDYSKSVRQFYDTYGWRTEKGQAQYLNDLRYGPPKTSLRDEKGCEARYWKYFEDGGRFFLDAGCGAKPIPQIGHKFERHVCVDLSLVGLTEARQKLGEHGLYVVADLTALPFKDQVFDGVVASYCLYLMQKDSQVSALKQFYRVIKMNKTILVFSVAKNSVISITHRVGKALVKAFRLLSRLFPGRSQSRVNALPPPDLQSPFRISEGFRSVDITCLRTLTRVESHFLRKLHLLEPALRLFSFLEKKFPRAMLWVGAYAAIRIQKID